MGAECRFFQALANVGHYRDPDGTRQGIYVCAPSGRLLASINSLDPEAVCRTLDAGLAAWEKLPAAQRRLPADFAGRAETRWESRAPRDGLILESTNRDLTGARLPLERGDRWNRDHAWFSRAEARAWLPAESAPGAAHELPTELTNRLARFHLVDNVRGQTLPFARADVTGSRIVVRVVERRPERIELAIEGQTRAASSAAWDMPTGIWTPEPRHPRGIATRLRGRAVYDPQQAEFTEFELVALGQRWGFSDTNARRHEPEPGLIGFVFRLAPPGAAQFVTPAFIDVYDADWAQRP